MDKRSQEIDDLKAQMDDIAKRLKTLSRTAAGSALDESEGLREEIAEYLREAKDRWNDASDEFKDTVYHAKEKTQQVAKQADEYVHDNPWVVIAGAAALGVLAGLFIRRSANEE